MNEGSQLDYSLMLTCWSNYDRGVYLKYSIVFNCWSVYGVGAYLIYELWCWVLFLFPTTLTMIKYAMIWTCMLCDDMNMYDMLRYEYECYVIIWIWMLRYDYGSVGMLKKGYSPKHYMNMIWNTF